jgi:hypothetical protein
VVVRVAVPFFKTPVPMVTKPCRNVTVPEAVAGETVAVSVTLWFRLDGFGEDVRVVEVGCRTTCVTLAEVLVASLPSPP